MSSPNPTTDIDDLSLAVGADFDVDDFGDIFDFCTKSPTGQHVYSITDNYQACVHCHEDSGL